MHYIVMLLLLLLLLTYPLSVRSSCLGVADCNCEPVPGGSGQVINCRNRDLTAVPTFDLAGSETQYAELTLAGNRIASIPPRAFAGLQFRRLDLSDNPLDQLDALAFSGLEQGLNELRMSLSQGAEFPATAISPLTRLQILQVTGFTGRQLPSRALSTLSELVELWLTLGSLTALNVEDLKAQRGSLQTLVLHGNELSAVPTAALSAATMLTTLDLSRNQVQSLPADIFAGLVNLNVVDLSNNGLGGGGLDAAAFRGVGDRLRTLTMKSCQLGDHDVEALRQLHAVAELVLSYNSIANLPANLFNRMRSLRRLRLNNNRLQTITRSIFSSTSSTLEVLDLGHNPLSSVPVDAILDLNYLQELRLDGVTTIQLGVDSFTPQHHRVLRTLSVRGSGLGDRLWPIVSNLEGLNSLVASESSVSSIPDFSFRRNAALRTIDLSSNSISSLTQKSVYGLAGSLTAINLHGNSITTIHRCTFYGFSSSFDYFKLGLGTNPLRCDCDLSWLRDLLRAADSFRLGGLPWTCDNGDRFADADFNWCPAQQYNCSVITPPEQGNSRNSTGTGELPSLVLQAYNLSDTVCLLEWSIYGDTADITDFTVTREVIHGSTRAVSVNLPGSARRHRLTDLQPSTEYTVCIAMTTSGPTSTPVCTSVWTNASPDEPLGDEYRRRLAIILASIFGATILLAVTVIVVVLLRRYCARRPVKAAATSDSGFVRSTTTRPQVGFGSRRFAKDRAGAADKPRTVSTVSGNGPGERISAAFTPEERATILAMLAGTRVSGAPSLPAYTNPAYDPGSSEFAAESNVHVYDAIPDEQFDEVPLDSAV